MKILSLEEKTLIEKLFQSNQSQLIDLMGPVLKKYYGPNNVILNKNYIIAIGESPIALVSHLDTVFEKPPTNIFYDKEKNVMWSPEGLGADDRAGLYAIIQIIKSGLKPTILLVTDEEKGCLGAEKMVTDFPQPVSEVKYIVELDRKGVNDCVFYDCDNPNFNEYIQSFGFELNYGSFSDISTICPAWGIAGVNLSIGYFNEHSFLEMLSLDALFATVEKIKLMLADINNAPYFYYIPKKKNNYSTFFNWNADFFNDKKYSCIKCHEEDYEYNLFPVKDQNNNTIYLCVECMSESPEIDWCPNCKNYFFNENIEKDEVHLCQECRKGE